MSRKQKPDASIPTEPDYPVWFDGKRINEVMFSKEFLNHHPMKCVRGRLFTVDGLVEDEGLISSMISDEIQSYVSSGLSKRVANILANIKLEAYAPGLPLELDRIHTANGTYFLDGYFAEEKAFCSNRLNVNYNPQAPQPEHWLKFLSELLEAEDILTLQQYLGYCLIPTTKAQKMLMIIGKGGEGKSQIGRVLAHIFGTGMNTASIQKVENNRFSRADLEHKLLMIDDDMDLSALPKTNYIKTIVTAEGKMDLERKGIQSYQSQLYVRFLCFGNGALDSLHDKSDGFYRRQIILTAKERPANRMDDPFIAEAMIREKEGIFLWMLQGLYSLLSRNFQFSISNQSVRNLESLRRSGNNVIAFLESEGYIRFRADGQASSQDIYRAYQQWCTDNVEKPLSFNRLRACLSENQRAYNVEPSGNIYVGNRRVRGFWGIEVLTGKNA